ncbi:MAG: ADP-ribosylglycohydrolase family protein [Bacteroidales bacterium]|nr:ADP-ribosylglycohydrolase family protein [Bacteroidales bacterium]
MKISKTIRNKIKGLIFGQAIGDALGLGTEFLSRSEVQQYYPQGISEYEQIVQDKHRARWNKGDWTDDTDQFMCILNSIIKCQEIDLLDIARQFYEWFKSTPMGIGTMD